jgi:RNA polymerase sigma-32 factor
MGRLATADWNVTAGSGLSCYLWQIRRFPMLEPHQEHMLAKRWREHGDHEAAHKLVNSHLRLVAKIARGYRGYGLPISDVISEGNVGLMQAVQRFKPEKGFRFATYAAWWIRAAIQEYILRSWSLVHMATTTNRRKLFFNLRKAKNRISVIDEGDMRHDQIKTIAKELRVTKQDVIDVNRWFSGDASLNAPIREDSDSGEWQDWLVDEGASQETTLAARDEYDHRRKTLASALCVLNERERRIFEARRLAEDPITLADLASEFGVSPERVRQIDVRSFEKVQKAVKNGVAAKDTPAPRGRCVSFQPSSVVGETDDGRVAIGTFTATETTREGRRPPRLSRALQMESYPKFHNEVGVPIVRIGCREFKCIGDKPPQDHPHVYLNMGDASEIVCPYCSTLFRFDQSLGAHEADPADCAYGDMD